MIKYTDQAKFCLVVLVTDGSFNEVCPTEKHNRELYALA